MLQRASLLAFERMISNCSLEKSDIGKMQESYILFQSQLLLQEITPQQQGIELYHMMRENMFIHQQTADIEKQINALFTRKNSINESKENLILFFLAVLGIFEVTDLVLTWRYPSISSVMKIITSLLGIAVISVLYLIKRHK